MVEGHYAVTPEAGGAIAAKIADGTRPKFRDARRDGVKRSQDYYAAQAFVEAIVGEPVAADDTTTDTATPKPKPTPQPTAPPRSGT